MKPFPTLHTDRLVLREYAAEDAPDVQRLVGEWEVARTLAVVPYPYQDGMAEDLIASHRPAYEAKQMVTWAVVLRAEDELIGTITLHLNARDDDAELGYWIGRPYWGRGYATVAAREVVRYGFEGLGLHRIHAEHLKPRFRTRGSKLGQKWRTIWLQPRMAETTRVTRLILVGDPRGASPSLYVLVR